MKALLANVAHPAIGSRLAGEHLPPLGLLAVGGPLIDAGHEVRLLDGDLHNTQVPALAEQIRAEAPDALLLGHSGSTSAQPVLDELSRLVRAACPEMKIILGGVHPTFHWREILARQPQYDVIVRGEGEETTPKLLHALETRASLDDLPGIAWRKEGLPLCNPPAEPIADLDAFRIGWELMAGYEYTYWGRFPAVLYQFSRGCSHACTYCGQRLFWRVHRHRDPERAAEELARLRREYGIRVVNFADESPAEDQAAWRAFLEALVARNLNLILVGSIRADHIERDADFLHLYKEAGFERFLLGIEGYDERVLRAIRKRSRLETDRAAIRLLRRRGILSMATYAVGFGDEGAADLWRVLLSLLRYDPDQIQFVYATPLRWTPFFQTVKDRPVIQPDQRKWDFRHQILASRLPAWLLILLVKLIEVVMQTRPRALFRLFLQPNRRLRAAMFWYSWIGRRVWFYELFCFFFADKRAKRRVTVAEFWDGRPGREDTDGLPAAIQLPPHQERP